MHLDDFSCVQCNQSVEKSLVHLFLTVLLLDHARQLLG